MRYGKIIQQDVDINPSYHDDRWNLCRECGCNGDLRWGLCWACAMTKSKCDDKNCKSETFVYFTHGNGD